MCVKRVLCENTTKFSKMFTIFKMIFQLVILFHFFLLKSYVICQRNEGQSYDKNGHGRDDMRSMSMDMLYVRVTEYDNGFVLLEDDVISCDIIDDGEDVISRSLHGYEAIDEECPFVAGMFTVDDKSGLFLPVRTNAIHHEYFKYGYLDYLDVWLCLTPDWENATQIYKHERSYDPESLQSCWLIMNTQTFDAYHVPSNSMYSLKASRIDVSETFIVPFYAYNEQTESFEILQFKDVFKTNGLGSWDHALETRRAQELYYKKDEM